MTTRAARDGAREEGPTLHCSGIEQRPEVMMDWSRAATLVAVLLAMVFGLLSALHLFWAAGGRWGASVSVPQVARSRATDPTAAPRALFTPGPGVTLLVALALALAGALVLATAGVVRSPLPAWPTRLGAMVLGALFVLRAVGDLRYIGFFKSVTGTPFARYDSWFFSPLCLSIGAAVLWLAARSEQ